jgi:hypothetical protein
VFESASSNALLALLLNGAAKIECTFFMTWGATADESHAQIHEILEGGADSQVSCRIIPFIGQECMIWDL